MFTTDCFIRKNTKELRDKLEDLGYKMIFPVEFDNLMCCNGWVNDISTEIISFNKKIQEHNSFINNADAKKNVKIKVWEYAINLCLDALATYHSQKNPLEKQPPPSNTKPPDDSMMLIFKLYLIDYLNADICATAFFTS